jgi:hypothetical protein
MFPLLFIIFSISFLSCATECFQLTLCFPCSYPEIKGVPVLKGVLEGWGVAQAVECLPNKDEGMLVPFREKPSTLCY